MSVILGPLVASERWAKKRKLAVNTRSSEITDRCKFAMAVVGNLHLEFFSMVYVAQVRVKKRKEMRPARQKKEES